MTPNANVLTPRATRDDATRGGRRGPTPLPPAPPCSQLRAFVDALDRLGYDVVALLAQAGLRRAELDDPDGTVPGSAFNAVITRACEQRRVPNLGAHLATVTPIGAYPLLDYLVVTSGDVGGALEQLVRYFHLTEAPVRLAIAEEVDSVRLLVQRPMTGFVADYETSIVVHHLREETEHRLRPSYVSLEHEPDDRADLERLLGCRVHAPSTWTGIEFSRDSLRLPLRRRDPTLRGVLEGHAANVAQRSSVADEHSTIDQVRGVVASRLGRGVPAIGVVARQLTIAPRTLQRRLAAEGASYQQLVDVVRREAAERLLTDASMSIGEIGYLLGFSEPSAFHRAFKRWHSLTPHEYRNGKRERAVRPRDP
jgi:AraC-like DNA-binding protein